MIDMIMDNLNVINLMTINNKITIINIPNMISSISITDNNTMIIKVPTPATAASAAPANSAFA